MIDLMGELRKMDKEWKNNRWRESEDKTRSRRKEDDWMKDVRGKEQPGWNRKKLSNKKRFRKRFGWRKLRD